MDYQAELLREARKALAEFPEQRSKIIGLYRLAVDEIEDGGSPAHEYELFMGSIGEIKQRKETRHV
jgi:hypothetical protein